MSLLAVSELEDNIPIPESPDSLRPRTFSPPLHEHLRSTSDEQDPNADTEDDVLTEHKFLKQSKSSRSSISSFPGSVIHTIPFTDTEDAAPRTPSRSRTFDQTNKPPTNSYLSIFRHPSSVRALQLESEYADSDASSIRDIRSKRSPKISYFSTRSPGSVHSSPTKRSSRPGTPRQQSGSKLKKEFPLVLLHCSLLPPAVTTRGPPVSEEILEAVLPEEYRKRWKTLQDKVAKNSEIRQRGVLIPHPRDDYELLEERLLETLELERPRIRKGHYLGSRTNGGSDSGFESSSQNGTDEGSDEESEAKEELGDKCPDCGHAVSCETEQERRWEIKVFAANGLMKSGAWAAAWEEMEKVDVEVGMWMPEDVRLEVEERLKALQAKEEAERPIDEPFEAKTRHKRTRSNTAKLRHDERMREIYGEIDRSETGGDSVRSTATQHAKDVPDAKVNMETSTEPSNSRVPQDIHVHEDFIPFIRRHLHSIWNDQKNLAIVVLSVLVLFFSVQSTNTKHPSQPSDLDASALSTTSRQMIPSTDIPSLSYVTTTVYSISSAIPSSEDIGLVPNSEFNWRDSVTLPVLGPSTSTATLAASYSNVHSQDLDTTLEPALRHLPEEENSDNKNESTLPVVASDVPDILQELGHEMLSFFSEPETNAAIVDASLEHQILEQNLALPIDQPSTDQDEITKNSAETLFNTDSEFEQGFSLPDMEDRLHLDTAIENEV